MNKYQNISTVDWLLKFLQISIYMLPLIHHDFFLHCQNHHDRNTNSYAWHKRPTDISTLTWIAHFNSLCTHHIRQMHNLCQQVPVASSNVRSETQNGFCTTRTGCLLKIKIYDVENSLNWSETLQLCCEFCLYYGTFTSKYACRLMHNYKHSSTR